MDTKKTTPQLFPQLAGTRAGAGRNNREVVYLIGVVKAVRVGFDQSVTKGRLRQNEGGQAVQCSRRWPIVNVSATEFDNFSVRPTVRAALERFSAAWPFNGAIYSAAFRAA